MIADDLRAAVQSSGLSPYMVAKRSGVNKTIVVAFLAGRPTSLDKAERIAAAIGKSLRLGGKNAKILSADGVTG